MDGYVGSYLLRSSSTGRLRTAVDTKNLEERLPLLAETRLLLLRNEEGHDNQAEDGQQGVPGVDPSLMECVPGGPDLCSCQEKHTEQFVSTTNEARTQISETHDHA